MRKNLEGAPRRTPSSKDWTYRRGDIYMANLNPFKGSEQGGIRPVLVLQNDAGNFYCPTLIVAPITSRLKKTKLPTHCCFQHVGGLDKPSMVTLEQIKTIDKQRIISFCGKLTKNQMDDVDEALHRSLGLYIPETAEAP